MKKNYLLLFIISNISLYAQIEGKWKTIDDETKEPKSIVEIFKHTNGKYYGKIINLLLTPENKNCVKCKDDRKDMPLLGLEIIREIEQDGDEFTNGTIIDPKTGKIYKCTMKLDGKDKLNLRGYIGISIIGRTQVWYKVDEYSL